MQKALKLLLATFIFVLPACIPATKSSESAFQLQLLHFADVDGGGDVIGNVSRFSALLDKFRSEMPDKTLVLSSGDNWTPGPEYNVASDNALGDVLGTAANGRAHVAWLNSLGVQASAIGNHELDLGPDDFAALIAPSTTEGDTWTGANFPYLSTNIDFSADSNFTEFKTDNDDETSLNLVAANDDSAMNIAGKVAGYTTLSVNGEMVGVIGASTPSLASITSVGNLAISPDDPDDTAALAALIQEDVDALTTAGVNKIILLAHMQSISIENALAEQLSGVDIIVAGGSNTLLADNNDRLRDGDSAANNYPLEFQGADGNPVLVVNTDGDYSYLGRLIVNFDKDGVLLSSSLDNAINGVYAADEQGLSENGLSSADAISEVQAIANALNSALQARAGNGVGFTDVYLNGERGSVRTEETNLGNLSADANLAYAQSIDASTAISLKNGGGIRGPIGSCIVPPGSNAAPTCGKPAGVTGVSEPGEVTQLDLEIAFRFNNGLTLVTVTGEQLLALVENGVSRVEDVSGRFLQIAGMTVSYDPGQPAGSRVASLVVEDSNGAEAGGESVEVVSGGALNENAATRSFRMVSIGFLVAGGDDYPFPAEDDGAANIVQLEQEGTATGDFTFADDGTEQDVLAEYMSDNFGTAATAYAAADTPAAEDLRITITSLP